MSVQPTEIVRMPKTIYHSLPLHDRRKTKNGVNKVKIRSTANGRFRWAVVQFTA
jgi:hypothetical protein